MEMEVLAAAFNSWLEDYIEHPETFLEIEAEIALATQEASNGEIPSYGTRAAELLKHYVIANEGVFV